MARNRSFSASAPGGRLAVFILCLLFALGILAAPAPAEDCDPYYDMDCESGGSSVSSTQPQSTAVKAARKVQRPPYRGPKQTIAVLTFENKTKNVPRSWNLGEGLTEMFITELFNTNRFIIVERTAFREILREQELGQSGLVRAESAPRAGGLAGAQFLIKGAVTEFRFAAEGSGFGLDIKGISMGTESKTAHVGIDVRIIDASTGQITASKNARANADASGFRLGFSKNDLRIGTGQFKSTPLGVAAREAIVQAIEFIIDKSQSFRWSGSIIKVVGDRAYVNRGSVSGIHNGQRLMVYNRAEALIDPETGINLGSEESLIGELQITDVQEKYSIGVLRLTGAARPKRGDAVRLP